MALLSLKRKIGKTDFNFKSDPNMIIGNKIESKLKKSSPQSIKKALFHKVSNIGGVSSALRDVGLVEGNCVIAVAPLDRCFCNKIKFCVTSNI